MKNKKKYVGFLHFDYHFYHKIMCLSKMEIKEEILKLENILNNNDLSDEDRFNFRREYDFMTERYNELV